MKKKIFIICMFFLCVFLLILGYKFFATGNNKTIESEEQLCDYILNINDYSIEAKVTIYSNKNINTYSLKQFKKGERQIQEIINTDENYGVIIENEGEKVTIKNTKLDLTSVFENYKEVTSNSIGLDSFIEDYQQDKSPQITEDEESYIIKVKRKNNRNIYLAEKTLYVNKKNRKISKIEVTDVNKDKTILIEYTKFEIL